ncbi:MAG: AAA family ATPase [Acidobacteria bacterium]|nr:AAA family ATPase [Acidobacteriota bacterium]
MLTRLQISGFKNLVDVDVRFGPFTCITGSGDTGKSNLLDALRFMQALTEDTLAGAARRMLPDDGEATDLRRLFARRGEYAMPEVAIAAEMIIPHEGEDPYGWRVEAGITLVRYSLVIGRAEEDPHRPCRRLELRSEHLDHINIGDAHLHLWFPHRANSWRRSVMHGRRATPFITTETEGSRTIIRLNQDGSGGRPRVIPLAGATRTALSTVNGEENPTAMLVRQEIGSWQVFRLQPAALQQPDELTIRPRLTMTGCHLPATLLRRSSNEPLPASAEVMTRDAGELSRLAGELLENVTAVRLRCDSIRHRLDVEVVDTGGMARGAGQTGGGTLLFLGMMTAALPAGPGGLVCIENPESGQDARRLGGLVRFLHGMATDVFHAVGPDNALHQILITTHSPLVVNQVPDDSLLVARTRRHAETGVMEAVFEWLPDTWRHERLPDIPTVDKQFLRELLNPTFTRGEIASRGTPRWRRVPPRRVGDRPDLQPMLPFWRRPHDND